MSTCKNILFSFTKHTVFRESCRPEELGTGVTCEVTKLRLLIRHRTQNEEVVTLHGQNPSVLPSRAFPQIVDRPHFPVCDTATHPHADCCRHPSTNICCSFSFFFSSCLQLWIIYNSQEKQKRKYKCS